MDWNLGDMELLFKLYQQHFRTLCERIIAANQSHGSNHPDKSWMEPLGKKEFEMLLRNPSDPDVAKRWVKRIIRGHEHEFPNALVA